MLHAKKGKYRFEIKNDEPNVGAYLYIYENDKCIRDDLQNDEEACKLVALEDYEVPFQSWNRVG